jgi:hypothetical protein
LQYATKQCLMPVANERQIQIVLEGIRGARGGEPAGEQAPPKGSRDLDVTEGWDMEVGFVRLQDASDFASTFSLQEIFNKR